MTGEMPLVAQLLYAERDKRLLEIKLIHALQEEAGLLPEVTPLRESGPSQILVLCQRSVRVDRIEALRLTHKSRSYRMSTRCQIIAMKK